jgi:hypothetical protein
LSFPPLVVNDYLILYVIWCSILTLVNHFVIYFPAKAVIILSRRCYFGLIDYFWHKNRCQKIHISARFPKWDWKGRAWQEPTHNCRQPDRNWGVKNVCEMLFSDWMFFSEWKIKTGDNIVLKVKFFFLCRQAPSGGNREGQVRRRQISGAIHWRDCLQSIGTADRETARGQRFSNCKWGCQFISVTWQFISGKLISDNLSLIIYPRTIYPWQFIPRQFISDILFRTIYLWQFISNNLSLTICPWQFIPR